jgi:hypothetical protein
MLFSSTIEGFPLHQAVKNQDISATLTLLREASCEDFDRVIVCYNLEQIALHGQRNAVGAAAKLLAIKIHSLVVHFKLLHSIAENNVGKVESTLKTNRKIIDVSQNFPFIQGVSNSLLWIVKSSWATASQALMQTESDDPQLLQLQNLVANSLKIWNLLSEFDQQKKSSGATLPQ